MGLKKYGLQRFAEAIKGKKIIYLYRVHETASEKEGTLIAFTTENSRSVSVDADSTVTKDGTIRTPSEPEIEITATSILIKGDTFIGELETAMKNNKLMDIWEVNLEEPGSGANKFKGTYFQGYLTDFGKASNAEDFVEISLTFGINGKGAAGDVTVSASQQEQANYVFADTTKAIKADKDASTIIRSGSASTTDTVSITQIQGTNPTVNVKGHTDVISAQLGAVSQGAATLTITATQGTTAASGIVEVVDVNGFSVTIAVTVNAPGA